MHACAQCGVGRNFWEPIPDVSDKAMEYFSTGVKLLHVFW